MAVSPRSNMWKLRRKGQSPSRLPRAPCTQLAYGRQPAHSFDDVVVICNAELRRNFWQDQQTRVAKHSKKNPSVHVDCDKHAVSCCSLDVAPGPCPKEETGSAGCETDKTSASTSRAKKRFCTEAATSRRVLQSLFVVELKTTNSLRFTFFSHDASRILSFDQPNTNNEPRRPIKLDRGDAGLARLICYRA